MRARPLLLLVVACGSGCLDFPREDRIEDLRILAMRTEPAEILWSPLHLVPRAERPPLFPLPTTDVEVTAWAYDPRGGLVEAEIQLCPAGVTSGESGDSSCRLFDPGSVLEREPAAAREELSALYLPRKELRDVDLEGSPVGAVPSLSWSFAFTPAVVDSIIPDDDLGNPLPSLFPFLPRFVLEVENGDAQGVTKERAFKRIPLTLDLTSPDLPDDVKASLAEGLGVALCDGPLPEEGFAEGEADCLAPRTANLNPDLVGFDVFADGREPRKEVVTGEQALVGPNALLAVDRGARLTVEPVLGAGTIERYQVVGFDIERSRVELQNRVEDIAVSWYTTRGDASPTLTAEQLTEGLGATWQLPRDVAAGDRDTLVVVVLDQRGGTAVGQLTIEYR